MTLLLGTGSKLSAAELHRLATGVENTPCAKC